MTEAASNLLAAFEALSPQEQLELAAEILRRAPDYEELSVAALHQVADDVFLSYDAEEEAGGKPARLTRRD